MNAATPLSADWIAVDWGTSRLRAWAMSNNGTVLDQAVSEQGMGALDQDGFEPALLALISQWLAPDRKTTVVACGMVGSRQGWAEAAYRRVPCPPTAPDRATVAPAKDPRLHVLILPGLKQSEPADVMRGEETQIGGLLSTLPDFDSAICLPGTHSKWVLVQGGAVVRFATYMTGEAFALFSKHSVLRHGLSTEGWSEPDFEDGINATLENPGDLLALLFSLRAEGLLNGLAPGAARSKLSGMVIGAELASAKPFWTGKPVAVIGDDPLARLYRRALRNRGSDVIKQTAADMTLAGLGAAHQRLCGETAE